MTQIPQKRAKVVSLSEKQLEKDQLQLLIEKVAKDQDRAAFSELFTHFAPLLKSFAFAHPYGSDTSQFADELTQEVMIKIWNKASKYDAKYAAVSTWVFTIARNTRIDMIRKHGRTDFPLDSEEVFDFEDESIPELFQQVQQKHYERDTKRYFSELPAEQSQIIAKIYMEGKSHSEVAAELDLPLGTVKSRVRLALSKLKAMVVH